jgi:hypothetical protein
MRVLSSCEDEADDSFAESGFVGCFVSVARRVSRPDHEGGGLFF